MVVCIILLVISIGGTLWLWTSFNQANSEITSLETTVYTKSSEIENLEQKVDSLGLEKEALEAQTSDLLDYIQILDTFIDTKESEIETLESQVTGLQADKNNLQSQVSSLETDKSQLESQVTSLQTDKSSLETQVNSLETENNQLQTWLYDNKSQISSLENEIESLKDENTWLKQQSFTYYTVGDAINISSVEIEIDTWFDDTTVKGNITNISNKAMDEVWVYVILRNPDGTIYFDSWKYEIITDLYIGETTNFDIIGRASCRERVFTAV